MPDESKKAICEKCGIYFWVDIHHIHPRAVFGGKGDKATLCPNCHRDYHEHLGRDNLKNPDPKFHEDFFQKWLIGALTVLVTALAFWLSG